MDEKAKKTALRMIPYGLFLLGAGRDEHATAATVNWVTQASFDPPLVVVGVKEGSETLKLVEAEGQFSISVLGTGQKEMAFAFFRHVEPEDGTLAGYAYETHATGCPVFTDTPAWWECRVVSTVREGDHAIVVGEVVEAGVHAETDPLTLRECGVNYGG